MFFLVITYVCIYKRKIPQTQTNTKNVHRHAVKSAISSMFLRSSFFQIFVFEKFARITNIKNYIWTYCSFVSRYCGERYMRRLEKYILDSSLVFSAVSMPLLITADAALSHHTMDYMMQHSLVLYYIIIVIVYTRIYCVLVYSIISFFFSVFFLLFFRRLFFWLFSHQLNI